jgi:hypothetical protein
MSTTASPDVTAAARRMAADVVATLTRPRTAAPTAPARAAERQPATAPDRAQIAAAARVIVDTAMPAILTRYGIPARQPAAESAPPPGLPAEVATAVATAARDVLAAYVPVTPAEPPADRDVWANRGKVWDELIPRAAATG